MITTRHEHPAQKALRRIVADVSAIIPRALKGDEYWRMTVEAHDAFIDAVRACEQHDTLDTRDAVRKTGAAWKAAWMAAVEQWKADQRATA